jgi:hypothetical protein
MDWLFKSQVFKPEIEEPLKDKLLLQELKRGNLKSLSPHLPPPLSAGFIQQKIPKVMPK